MYCTIIFIDPGNYRSKVCILNVPFILLYGNAIRMEIVEAGADMPARILADKGFNVCA
jgi:hypothetical protein